MTTKFKSGWYVIYTRPKQERKVAGGLAESGIDHLLPTARTLRTWSDRKKYIDAPMFPSYIFVHLRNRQDYFNALNVEGALFYIRFGKEVATVRNQVIDGLRLILENSPEVEVSNLRFQPGQQLAPGDINGMLRGWRIARRCSASPTIHSPRRKTDSSYRRRTFAGYGFAQSANGGAR